MNILLHKHRECACEWKEINYEDGEEWNGVEWWAMAQQQQRSLICVHLFLDLLHDRLDCLQCLHICPAHWHAQRAALRIRGCVHVSMNILTFICSTFCKSVPPHVITTAFHWDLFVGSTSVCVCVCSIVWDISQVITAAAAGNCHCQLHKGSKSVLPNPIHSLICFFWLR